MTSTGYWAIPGREPKGEGPKVHAVCNQKPICGQLIHPEAEYQWCAHGLRYDYIECEKCKAMIKRSRGNLPAIIRTMRDAARSLAEKTMHSRNPEVRLLTEKLIVEIKESEEAVPALGLCTTIT